MKKFTCMACVAAVALLAACNKGGDNPPAQPDQITIADDQKAVVAEADQTSASIVFTTTGTWTAAVETSAAQAGEIAWLTLSAESGEAGETTLSLTLVPNTEETPRAADIRIVCGTASAVVNVMQKGIDKPLPPKDALIKGMIVNSKRGTTESRFTFDKQDRLVKVESKEEGSDFLPAWEAEYTPDKLTETLYFYGDKLSPNNYVLKGGLPVENDIKSSFWTYNPDGTLAEYKHYYSKPNGAINNDNYSTETYTWENGNLTKVEVVTVDKEDDGTETRNTDTFTFVYGTDEAHIKGFDLFSYVFGWRFGSSLRLYGLCGSASKNLPTSYAVTYKRHDGTTFTDAATCTYEFDKTGPVTKMRVLDGEGNETQTIDILY